MYLELFCFVNIFLVLELQLSDSPSDRTRYRVKTFAQKIHFSLVVLFNVKLP